MLKKSFIAILALLGFGVATAQTPINDLIFAEINNTASQYYYPNLMMRYEASGDLTDEEYHYLYYGYAFHENYKPLNPCKALDDLFGLMAIIDTERPDKKDIEQIIMACNRAMEFDPFNPTVLNFLTYAYGNSGDTEKEQAYFRHMNGILETIKSSGDGRGEKFPMHIIMFSHATDLVASLGVEHRKAQIVSRKVEFIPLVQPRKVPDGKIKGFYFDYSRIYRNKPDDVTFQKKRTWQFNNLGVREYK